MKIRQYDRYNRLEYKDIPIDSIDLDNNNNINKENRCLDGSSQNNSRVNQKSVLMMLAIQIIARASDLGPLIESGLKKLSTISNISECNLSGSNRRSITSTDSYVSISSVESFPSSDSGSSLGSQSFLNTNNTNESGGLFSSVTHAVKKALSCFSGGNHSKSMPAEEISSSSSSLSSFASCLSSNSRKRSQDVIHGPPVASSTAINSVILHEDDRSPKAKRHREWPKIKGREPIARMRNLLTSSRGISFETQVFSQGSLSVRNMIIPIPARAHKSTQTDAASSD